MTIKVEVKQIRSLNHVLYLICFYATDSSQCVDDQITAPLLRCKTKKEWEDIGRSQCGLKGASLLTNTKVRASTAFSQPNALGLTCLFVSIPGEVQLSTPTLKWTRVHVFCFYLLFKKATAKSHTICKASSSIKPTQESQRGYLTCKILPSQKNDMYMYQHFKLQDSGLLQGETPDSPSNEGPDLTYLIPISLGVMLLLAFIALALIVWQRWVNTVVLAATDVHHSLPYRRRTVRHPQKPKMEFATSFVNPSAEHQPTEQDWAVNPLDTTDKSLLIVNEHPRK